MTALTAWYDYIMPDLPGCPLVAANKAILDAAQEYLMLSREYEVDLTPIDIVASQPDYAINAGAGLVLIEPVRVQVNGVDIDPLSEIGMALKLGSTWRTDAGDAKAYYMKDDDTMRIAPTPTAAITGGLVIRASVYPTLAATTLPDKFFNHLTHRNAIANGAKAALMMSQQKPYTNFEMGAVCRSQFEAACGRTNARIAKGRSSAPLRTRVVHGVEE